MRKIFIILILLGLINYSYSFANTNNCDQVFYGKLRYWQSYKFYDVFKNLWSTTVWIDTVDVKYKEQYDYNGSSNFPLFIWTDWIISKNFEVLPGEEGKIVETNDWYDIKYHPPIRSTDNFSLTYTISYYVLSNWIWRGPYTHVECKYYEITWCWDWVLDFDYGEQCDDGNNINGDWCDANCKIEQNIPKCWNWILETGEQCDDGNNLNWDWCSATCQLETPTCTVTASPLSWNVPLNVQFTATKPSWASYLQINFGDGNMQNNPVFPLSHTYINPWYYNITLTVQNNISNIAQWITRPTAQCQVTVTASSTTPPPPPTPICWDGKIDAWEQCDDGNNVSGDWCSATCQLETPNCSLWVSPTSWVVPLTVNISANKPVWATYKVLRYWDGNEVINPVFPLTYTYTNTWTYNMTLEVENAIANIAQWITRPTTQCQVTVTVSSTTPPPPPPTGPQCWPNSTTYSYTVSDWPSTDPIAFCNTGNLIGNIPSFPWYWETVTWQCELNWQVVDCPASRTSPPGWIYPECKSLKIWTDTSTWNDPDQWMDDNYLSINPGQTIYFRCEWAYWTTSTNIRFYPQICRYLDCPNIEWQWQILTWTYTFSSNGEYTVWCSYNRQLFQDTPPRCIWKVTVGWWWGWGGPYCWNGIVEYPEQCDDGNNVSGDWCSATCQLENLIVEPYQCIYIDPPSIQFEEYLPYWWKFENNSNTWSNTCDASNIWAYRRWSAKCTFEIINWAREAIEIQWVDCFDKTATQNNLIKDFIDGYPFSGSYYNADGANRYKITTVDFSKLWEYQIKLKSMDLQICKASTDSNGNPIYIWSSPTKVQTNVCLMNFAVTKPYIIQQGSIISELSNAKLNDFLNIDWTYVINSTILANIQNYTWDIDTTKINLFVQEFINKYYPLAVKTADINGKTAKWTQDLKIVFIDWGGSNISLEPFEVTNWIPQVMIFINTPQLNLKGNIWNNIVLITTWNIYLDDNDCDKPFVFDGILIANKIISKNLWNNDINKKWCENGQFIVHWNIVANIDNLFNTRRSILKDWWIWWIDKLQLIFDWGAIVIKTNTALFQNIDQIILSLLAKYNLLKK